MYEVCGVSAVYRRGVRYFPGEFLDAPDEEMSELVSLGIVREVEVPDAEPVDEPEPPVVESPEEPAKEQDVADSEEEAPIKQVKSKTQSRRKASPEPEEG